MRKNLHYDWHWVWPTGNGDLGNNGIHFTDICQWFLGKNSLPPRVMSIGGRFGYIDDGETPNTQIVFLDYQPAPIIFEVRGLPRAKGNSAMDDFRGTRAGVVVQCEDGYIVGGWAYDKNGKKIKQFKRTGGSGHHTNFIKAVRSRKVSDLNADIAEGH
ncbi:MAG: gfo/Idh/MocA family oxidoreductase, partial [Planctomycetota bacterium]